MIREDRYRRIYRMLEGLGFGAAWIRTDYRFANRAKADRLCRAFFGTTFPLQEEDRGWRLPECTGLWVRRKPG